VFLGAREAAMNTVCLANVNQIGRALGLYQGDNDYRMPLDRWTEAIGGYVGSREVYNCPELAEPYGYSMSLHVRGLDVSTVDAARVVSLFDGPGGKDSVGDASKVRYRHDGKYAVVGFLDGHARRMFPEDLPALRPAKR
jgi:prepilin-type processing-associated H-X9-DG protein